MSETSQAAAANQADSHGEAVVRRVDGPHRVEGPHRASVLVRVPNVNHPRTKTAPNWAGIAAKALSLISLRWTGPWAAVARAASVLLASRSAAQAEGNLPLESLEVKEPAAEPVSKPGMVGSFVGLVRARPAAMIPSMVASVLAGAMGLHMAFFTQPAVSPMDADMLVPPVIDTGIPAPGPITAVAPHEGNTPAPNSLGSDEPAWRAPGVFPESTTVPGPVIPGVARLQGRIEPLTPTVDARHDQYRPGVH